MKHITVLLHESVDSLNIRPDGIYVDGTLGMGGHSELIASRLESGRLICIDRDDKALEFASKRLEKYADRITFVKGNFGDLGSLLDSAGVSKADGMLFDLGVSSPQLDDAERGFSYMQDAPLDMRMDERAALTAGEIVNTWPEEELRNILWKYGEERYAARIVSGIIRARENAPIRTTGELVDIIRANMPAAALREKQHPAKRSFQAIRIAVNDELGSLERMLAQAPDRLNPGGRLCVISFHSLEDRIVKEAIRKCEAGCTCPREFPICTCGFVQTMRSISHRPINPTAEEIENNPRARSAHLRVAERI